MLIHCFNIQFLRMNILDFSFTAYEEEFQLDLTQRLARILPKNWQDESYVINNSNEKWLHLAEEITKDLSKDRLLTLAWPKKYGGLEETNLKQTIFNHVISYLAAPINNIAGIQWIGPTLMMHGNEEQKTIYLPRIAEAIDKWCMLYSEPTAGSDLASLQTRAIKNGDNYIINGQKLWSSNANFANLGLLAARTNPEAPKHKGISNFIVPMDSKGISINPIEDINGNKNLNEVYFDNVIVSAKNLVGHENRGWYQMASSIDFERSGVGAFSNAKRNIEKLVTIIKDNPNIAKNKKSARDDIADRWIELNTGFNLAFKIPLLQDAGINPTYEASVSKLYGAELTQKIAQTGMSILGMDGQLKNNSVKYSAADNYLASVANTIASGTSEIQRNTIANQGLGLPR
jgi:alkylation response protein AidB-like acyl-CoA dehydrogenase